MLGGIPCGHAMTLIISGIDLDTLLGDMGKSTIYQIPSTCSNMPSGAIDGYMQVFKWYSNNYSTQIFYDPNRDKVFIRSNRYGTTVSWESWSELSTNIPAFYKNYSTIAELITAVNGTCTTVSDLNNISFNGLFQTTNQTQHTPIEGAVMSGIQIIGAQGAKIQIVFRSVNGEIYYRQGSGTWYKFTGVAI